MSSQEGQKVDLSRTIGSSPNFDADQPKHPRGTVYVEFDVEEQGCQLDGSGDNTNCNDFHDRSNDNKDYCCELCFQSRRKLRFSRSFSTSETTVNSNDSLDTSAKANETSPLLNPLKPISKKKGKRMWLNEAWRWYEQNLNRRPLRTKAITSGCLSLVGDLVGQCIEQGSSGTIGNLDMVRLVKFSTLGMCLQAPVTHYYYVVLDYYLPPTPFPWTPTTFIKLAIDQLIFAPTFMLLVLLYLAICGESSWYDVRKEVEDEYWRTLVDNWKLWVPATVINMAYVPPASRVLYCNLVFFVWSIYLSLTLSS